VAGTGWERSLKAAVVVVVDVDVVAAVVVVVTLVVRRKLLHKSDKDFYSQSRLHHFSLDR
jgi:hypothetical protein